MQLDHRLCLKSLKKIQNYLQIERIRCEKKTKMLHLELPERQMAPSVTSAILFHLH